MTTVATALPDPIAIVERRRVNWYFALVLTGCVVVPAAAVASRFDGTASRVVCSPMCVPYLGWLFADLTARRVRGAARFWQASLGLVPGPGLLACLLLTRGLRGSVQWLAFGLGVALPGGMLALLANGVFAVATGQRWH